MNENMQDGYGAPYIDRGEPLPESYGEILIKALVRDPEGIYVYWDIDTETRISGSPLVLCSHVMTTDEKHFIDLEPDTNNMYFAVSSNTPYQFELYERKVGDALELLAQSNEVTTPVHQAGESGDRAPAEISHTLKYPIARLPASPGEVAAATGHGTAESPHRSATMPLPRTAPAPSFSDRSGSFYTTTSHS